MANRVPIRGNEEIYFITWNGRPDIPDILSPCQLDWMAANAHDVGNMRKGVVSRGSSMPGFGGMGEPMPGLMPLDGTQTQCAYEWLHEHSPWIADFTTTRRWHLGVYRALPHVALHVLLFLVYESFWLMTHNLSSCQDTRIERMYCQGLILTHFLARVIFILIDVQMIRFWFHRRAELHKNEVMFYGADANQYDGHAALISRVQDLRPVICAVLLTLTYLGSSVGWFLALEVFFFRPNYRRTWVHAHTDVEAVGFPLKQKGESLLEYHEKMREMEKVFEQYPKFNVVRVTMNDNPDRVEQDNAVVDLPDHEEDAEVDELTDHVRDVAGEGKDTIVADKRTAAHMVVDMRALEQPARLVWRVVNATGRLFIETDTEMDIQLLNDVWITNPEMRKEVLMAMLANAGRAMHINPTEVQMLPADKAHQLKPAAIAMTYRDQLTNFHTNKLLNAWGGTARPASSSTAH